MLNIEALITLTSKCFSDVTSNDFCDEKYQLIFDNCERYLYKVNLEYLTVFEFVKVDQIQKKALSDIKTRIVH